MVQGQTWVCILQSEKPVHTELCVAQKLWKQLYLFEQTKTARNKWLYNPYAPIDWRERERERPSIFELWWCLEPGMPSTFWIILNPTEYSTIDCSLWCSQGFNLQCDFHGCILYLQLRHNGWRLLLEHCCCCSYQISASSPHSGLLPFKRLIEIFEWQFCPTDCSSTAQASHCALKLYPFLWKLLH